MTKLRTGDTDVAQAMVQLKADVQGGNSDAGGGFGQLFGGGVATKALMIGIGLMFVQQLSGINAVMFYCGTILQSVFDPDTANKVAVGIQVMQCFITVVSAPLMDKAGRIPILLFAATGQCIAAMVLGAYYLTITCTHPGNSPHGGGSTSTSGLSFLSEGSEYTLMDTVYTHEMIAAGAEPVCTSDFPKIVAAIALYAYVGFFSCGMGAIPWFLMGEIFPAEVKGLASSVATAINWSLAFFITKTVGTLTDLFGGQPTGLGGVFVAYGCVCALGAVFVKLVIPETKGKSFEQIQREIGGGGGDASKPRNSVQQKSYQW